MPSLFPGMDPYLEQPDLWKECHTALIYLIHAQLNSRLPDGYTASTDIHVWLQEADAESRRVRREPDVFVSEVPTSSAATAVQSKQWAAPAEIVLPVVARRGHRYVTIRDKADNRVITAIEILSPANKAGGPDRDAYLAKRDDYFLAQVNLVEIDFLRSGVRPPLGDQTPERFAYYIMVCRNTQFPRAAFWSFGVRDAIPEIPVPLKPEDPDCPLDLKACL
ncbi:MAG: DUF4058 family protein, partial [Zavarzinella sp.]|nr:DUF4058 family protein [Zavarzinella sp.]